MQAIGRQSLAGSLMSATVRLGWPTVWPTVRSSASKPVTSAAKSSSRSEGAYKCEAVRPAPPGQQGNAGVASAVPRSLAESQAEVAAGGRRVRFEWSDVAVDEDGDVLVPGLGGDAVERDPGECGGGGVAGAQRVGR